jgi:predicted MFS family arabinose efflux permease
MAYPHPSTLAPQPFVRDQRTWLLYGLLGYFAYLLNSLGPVMPLLRAELELSYTLASLHASLYAVGVLLAGILTERVVRRYGRRASLSIGALGMASGALLVAVGWHPAWTLSGASLMGICGTLLAVLVQAILADLHGQQQAIAQAEANVMGSLGSVLVPMAVGAGVALGFGWRPALLGAVVVAVYLVVAVQRHTFPASAAGPPLAGIHRRAPLPAAFWVAWVMLMLVISIEFTLILWAADFLVARTGLSPAAAATSLSGFLGAMLVGRIIGSRVLRRPGSARPLRWASFFAVGVGFLLFWAALSPLLSLIGLSIAGLGVANLYPLVMAQALHAAHPHTDAASARTALAAGLAILGAPFALAVLADWLTIGVAYGMVLVLLAAAMVLSIPARYLKMSGK